MYSPSVIDRAVVKGLYHLFPLTSCTNPTCRAIGQEAPKACRNLIALAMEGTSNNTVFIIMIIVSNAS